jgi:hypothetical protein
MNTNVYVLTKFEFDETDMEILGVFASKESAVHYKNEFIREFFDIEEDVSDESLEDELMDVEFSIQQYEVR